MSGIGGAACIITVKKRMKRLLYNLHNEVLEAAENRINTECSLIVCEGISIGFAVENGILGVPSLYVRVYHTTRRQKTVLYSSLTVCEGVSNIADAGCTAIWFPHYM